MASESREQGLHAGVQVVPVAQVQALTDLHTWALLLLEHAHQNIDFIVPLCHLPTQRSVLPVLNRADQSPQEEGLDNASEGTRLKLITGLHPW